MKGFHQKSILGTLFAFLFYVIIIKHQTLREARVFGFEWMPYDHKFGFLRVWIEFINLHSLREIFFYRTIY